MAQLIEMPKLSDTMTVGTVVTWHKNKGDEVSNGDILAEIETDKATMELENFEDGFLLEVFVKEGSEVPIGSPLAAVGNRDEDISDLVPAAKTEDHGNENSPGAVPEKETVTSLGEETSEIENEPELDEKPIEPKIKSPPESEVSVGRILASPLAKKIAKEKNLDLSKIEGSGPHGRIVKRDLDSGEKPPSPEMKTGQQVKNMTFLVSEGMLEEKTVPISNMRSVIASRLLESKATIPHFYLQKEIDARPLRLSRESINLKLAVRQTGGSLQKITVNDLVLKACAEAIKWHPDINTSWADTHIHFHKNVNLAFGVAVDEGLLTPVIRNCESLSLASISREAKTLIEKARDKKLHPDEMTGSTFTVTNLGMFGIDFFNGIINPPNAAILSVGSSVKKPVVDSFGGLVPGETMILGLSCDHRLVDGAIAAKFLTTLAENLENPSSMLV